MSRDYRESEDSSSHQETARFAPLGIQNRRQRSQSIEDEQRLKKIVAHELGVHPAEHSVAKRLLREADLIEERITKTGKSVLNEKVSRIDHSDNYRRIGEI